MNVPQERVPNKSADQFPFNATRKTGGWKNFLDLGRVPLSQLWLCFAEKGRMTESPMPLCEDKVREQLKQVIDPELFVNIVDLGLIYVVDLQANEEDEAKMDVTVEMTMTSPMCPAGPQLVANSRQVVEALEEVAKVEIKVVMDPPWTQDMMTEDARDQLGIF